ncbi:MAG TPA: hypothetical protein VK213_12985 [Bacteroidales bacterium]|nr:hypothetical protein [Bacteroidales bacterium]
MRNRSFEEKQLSKKIFEIENVAAEISIELDIIFRELDRKGKWDEFMLNLDKIKPKKKYTLTDVCPQNYFESLHFAFDMMSKFDDLKLQVEISSTEADLLKGKGIHEIEMCPELVELLNMHGISVNPGAADAPPVKNDKFTDRICLYYLKSRRTLRLMEKALSVLKESKSYIFSRYC